MCSSIAEASKYYCVDKKTIKEYAKTGRRTVSGKSFQFYTGKRVINEVDKCKLNNVELIERCEKWIDKLSASGGRAWTLNVPANYSKDPDLLFTELINRYKLTNPQK